MLTNREKEVLELLKYGYTNKEIAKKLSVSINTSKAHVTAILCKLSVKNRLQAAIWAQENLAEAV